MEQKVSEQKVSELERYCGQLSLENALPKRLASTPAQRQAVIQGYRRAHPDALLPQMCEKLGVSRSWRYEKPTALEPTEADTHLRDVIERLCLAFPGLDYRPVKVQLHRDSRVVNQS